MLNFKKCLMGLLVTITLIATTACTSSSNDGLYKEGTYEVSATGMKGEVVLNVTFDENVISAIDVVEQQETAGISDAAFETIPEQIVTYQSLAIETVTGATVTSNAILTAVEDAVTQAGGDVECLKNIVIEKERVEETISETYEIVVVGGGASGLATAVSAAEEGASVIVIETNSYLGGNTVRSAGAMTVCDPETTAKNPMSEAQLNEVYALIERETTDPVVLGWQETVKEEIQAHLDANNTGVFDSLAFNSLQLYYRFNAVGNPKMIEDVQSRSLAAKNWLGELGLPWNENSHVVVGDNWPRWVSSPEYKSGIAYIDTFEKAIKNNELPVEILTSVHGDSLIVNENNEVVGVKATGANGSKYEIFAEEAVVLTTGGFAANKNMMNEYNDGRWAGFDNIKTTNDPSIQGDGIVMALNVGASVTDMAHIQILPIADPNTGYTDTIVGSSTNLYVNNSGERFVNEAADRDTLTNAILAQDGSELYIISSEDNAGIDENGLNLFGRNVDELLEQNEVVFKSDTIEDLAKQIGVDPTVLQSTVEKFNEAVVTLNDEEFGRTTFGGDLGNLDGTPEIKDGPYYACKRSPASHITKGGLVINEFNQVMNSENEVINGIYAAGEIIGGSSISGITPALTDGYKVGKYITTGSLDLTK